jgi:hypothetical protein
MSSSLRLPDPPESRFVDANDPRAVKAYLDAFEGWARDFQRSAQAALDQLSTQAGTGWTVANPTLNRTLDSAADTAAQVREQVGTLVNDLKNRSIIG